jgi:hypothetical protein
VRPFYDRADEHAALERRYGGPEGELLVVWGRRRVGKTEQLPRFLKGRRGFLFEGTLRAGMSGPAPANSKSRAPTRTSGPALRLSGQDCTALTARSTMPKPPQATTSSLSRNITRLSCSATKSEGLTSPALP